MSQIVEQTREEKVAMYMKLPKRQLVEMLIESNEVNAALPSYTEPLKLIADEPYVYRRPHTCPVCNGTRQVPNGFYLHPFGQTVSTSATPEPCRTCQGSGIVWG